jgi:hypothetical protein
VLGNIKRYAVRRLTWARFFFGPPSLTRSSSKGGRLFALNFSGTDSFHFFPLNVKCPSVPRHEERNTARCKGFDGAGRRSVDLDRLSQ